MDRTVHPSLEHRTYITVGAKRLCWATNCRSCTRSPEAVGLHSICFSIFREHCKVDRALDRLWTNLCPQNLWRGAPSLQIDRRPGLEVDLVRDKAKYYGISMLGQLPAELIHQIHKYSESAAFWCCVSALGLARELAQVQSDVTLPTASTPLCDVLAWTKGDSAALLSKKCPPYLRLTLDRQGIRKIERFQERPLSSPAGSDKEAFVFEHEDKFKDVVVIPKVVKPFIQMSLG